MRFSSNLNRYALTIRAYKRWTCGNCQLQLELGRGNNMSHERCKNFQTSIHSDSCTSPDIKACNLNNPECCTEWAESRSYPVRRNMYGKRQTEEEASICPQLVIELSPNTWGRAGGRVAGHPSVQTSANSLD
uniref:Uncharacterized protein n=1 Tax=Mus musculus TaxID=10090 RepID=Q9D3H9_MOUSE|nr:unnamed protein product [Mus musculus]